MQDHIVLDGNRGARLSTGPGISCGAQWAGHAAEGREPAYNAGVHDCDGCRFIGFASINALCGTGLEFSGPDALFERALFASNGDHFGRQSGMEGHKWSDGLTVNSGPRCTITDSVFMDNSDINLIVAEGLGGTIERNTVRMVNGAAFGGIMLDTFNSPAASNFSGANVTSAEPTAQSLAPCKPWPDDRVRAQVKNNTVDCGTRCHYGIEIGGLPWYPNATIRGPATVAENTIGGAGFLLNCDVAGVAGEPVTVAKNTLVGGCVEAFPCVSGSVVYNCSRLNIAPRSVVDREGETQPAPTRYAITGCP